MEKVGPTGLVIAIDQDPDAIAFLNNKFSKEQEKGTLILKNASFSNLESIVNQHQLNNKVQAIIADLGVSSHQIDSSHRGFSFAKEGLLDMRMNFEKNSLTAKHIINTFSKDSLTKVFKEYGEEPMAKRISAAILKERAVNTITTTTELASIIKKALPYKNSKKNPATKVFQALRIYINSELKELEYLLENSIQFLRPSGRIGIISFHSLEDRIVKHYFQKSAGKRDQNLPHRHFPLTQDQIKSYNQPEGLIIKPFPIVPKEQELAANPRSRSAKLRILQKIKA